VGQPVEPCLALPDATDRGGLTRSCNQVRKASCEHVPDRFARQAGCGEEFTRRPPAKPVAAQIVGEDERVAGFEKQVVAPLSREDSAACQAKGLSTFGIRASPQEFPEGPS